MLSHQLSCIESELRSLSLESRRSHPDVKQAAERAIVTIRPLLENASDDEVMTVLRSDVIVKPLLVALGTKQATLVLLALISLQKLITANALTSTSTAMLVGSLRILAETTNSEVLLKILQSILLLASPHTFDAGEETITQALGICLRLHSSTSSTIHNTAGAALRQVINLIFDRASAENVLRNTSCVVIAAELSGEQNLSPRMQSAHSLLLDLVHLTGGDPPQWLKIHGELSNIIVVELLNSLLKEHCGFINDNIVFVDVLRSQLRPLLLRLLSSVTSFPLFLRLVRCVCVIVQCYEAELLADCEMFLSLLIRLVEPEFQLWQRILALEAIKAFSMHPQLLLRFFMQFDSNIQSTKIYGSMMHALGRVITSPHHLFQGQHAQVTSQSMWSLHTQRSRGLDLLGEQVAPEYEELAAVALAMQSLAQIVSALSTLHDDSNEKECSADIASMVSVSLSPVLAAFTVLLDHAHLDEQVQYLLMVLQQFSYLAGDIDNSDTLIAIVKTLCEFALPPDLRHADDVNNIELRKHHISTSTISSSSSSSSSKYCLSSLNSQAMKALFNVCSRLGYCLNTSWIVILRTFEQLDIVLANDHNRHHSLASSVSQRHSMASADELQVLSSALTHLFSSTVQLSLEALLHVLNALGILSLSVLSNIDSSTNTSVIPNASTTTLSSSAVTASSLFSLCNLVKTVEYNLFRVSCLWAFVFDHLNSVVRHCSSAIRNYGVQCVHRLIKMALKQQQQQQQPASSPPQPSSSSPSSSSLPSQPLSSSSSSPPPQLLSSSSSPPPSQPLSSSSSSPPPRPLSSSSSSPPPQPLSSSSPSSSPLPPSSSSSSSLQPLLHTSRMLSQGDIISPLRTMLQGKYSDTGVAILSALYEVLQSCGQHLIEGWASVLSVCSDAVRHVVASSVLSTNTEFIQVGFRIAQLVVDDFLDCLPYTCFASLITVIGMYGRQRSATNISFTSIGLLWQVSDHISRLHMGEIEVSPRSSCVNESVLTLSDDCADTLRLTIFHELQHLCMDSRPEVRNSAVQILHSTVAACGEYMSVDAWQRCRGEVLFPLLVELFDNDSNAISRNLLSDAECDSQLGTESTSGRHIMMVMHHSRDTAEKQWDETRVHSLQGSSSVFRHYFSFHVSKESRQHWKQYLDIIEQCMTRESSEVAITAIDSMQQVLLAPNAVPVLIATRPLMVDVIALYTNVVLFAIQQKHPIVFDTYARLLDSVSCLLAGNTSLINSPHSISSPSSSPSSPSSPSSSPSSSCIINHGNKDPLLSSSSLLFNAQDVLVFLTLADRLASLTPSTHNVKPDTLSSSSSSSSLLLSRETSLQRATLLLIGRLLDMKSRADETLYEHVINQVVRYVTAATSTTTSHHRLHYDDDDDDEVIHDCVDEQRNDYDSIDNQSTHHSPALSTTINTQHSATALHASDTTTPREYRHGVSSFADNDVDVAHSTSSSSRVSMSAIAFASRSVPVLVQVYCDKCPLTVQGRPSVLCRILCALHAVMTASNIDKRSPLCAEATRAFQLIVQSGLHAINKVECSRQQSIRVWRILVCSMRTFLSDSTTTTTTYKEGVHTIESLQVSMVQLIHQHMLPNSYNAPEHLQSALVKVLASRHESQCVIGLKTLAAAHEPTGKTRLTHACMVGLFDLCTVVPFEIEHDYDAKRHSLAQHISTLTAPILLHRCRDVLLSFIGDERRSGLRPLPRGRRNEVAFILTSLRTLSFQDSIVASIDINGSHIGKTRQKGHLLQLYELLCDCICIREPDLQLLIRHLFRQLGSELCLIP